MNVGVVSQNKKKNSPPPEAEDGWWFVLMTIWGSFHMPSFSSLMELALERSTSNLRTAGYCGTSDAGSEILAAFPGELYQLSKFYISSHN